MRTSNFGIQIWLRQIIYIGVWCATACAAADLVLVTPEAVKRESIRDWKADRFSGVVLLLDETNRTALVPVTTQLGEASLPFHYWIEVGRNPAMAEAHPRWMASLGMHDDWQKAFPNVTAPKKGEIAKAFPWVPINYREAFEAHVERVQKLLAGAPTNHQGVFLNHLQAGPSSCGCGNLQCRWATDYGVSATGTFVDDAAGRFLSAVREFARGKPLIPVWTTECEHNDLPADRAKDGKSTGLCGTVGCSVGQCPKDFTKQWNSLRRAHAGSIALLALHREFGRTNVNFAHGAAWVPRTVGYLDETLPNNGGAKFPRDRLTVVVQGATRKEEHDARAAAKAMGVANVIVSRVRLDQSFQPRILRP
jgi:hypothetical protein